MSVGGGVSFGDIPCAVCEEQAASWQHHLEEAQSHFRVYGKGHVWGSPVPLCDICDEALLRGDVELLVDRDPRAQSLTGADLDHQVRNGHAALAGATVRRESLSAAVPPEWNRAVADGFAPMEQITGALHLVDGWPAEHRRSVAAQDPGDADHLPHGTHWFLRSPWPSVDLEALWHLVIHTIEAAPGSGDGAFTHDVAQAEVATVRELVSRDEQAILLAIRHLP